MFLLLYTWSNGLLGVCDFSGRESPFSLRPLVGRPCFCGWLHIDVHMGIQIRISEVQRGEKGHKVGRVLDRSGGELGRVEVNMIKI